MICNHGMNQCKRDALYLYLYAYIAGNLTREVNNGKLDYRRIWHDGCGLLRAEYIDRRHAAGHLRQCRWKRCYRRRDPALEPCRVPLDTRRTAPKEEMSKNCEKPQTLMHRKAQPAGQCINNACDLVSANPGCRLGIYSLWFF